MKLKSMKDCTMKELENEAKKYGIATTYVEGSKRKKYVKQDLYNQIEEYKLKHMKK